MNIEKQIYNQLRLAKNNLQGYREKTQLAFELFISHYNKELNYNSKPLLMIVKTLAQKDKKPFIDYVKQVTNIDKLTINKDGCKLVFTNNATQLTFNDSLIDSFKWYTIDKNKEKQPFIYNDESFIKTIKALIKKLEKSQVKNSKNKINTLQSLI